MKKVSDFLEKTVVGNIRMRSLLTIILCVVNFLLAYGICLYFSLGGSPVLMWICLVITLVMVAVLACPNMQTQDDAEATDVVE